MMQWDDTGTEFKLDLDARKGSFVSMEYAWLDYDCDDGAPSPAAGQESCVAVNALLAKEDFKSLALGEFSPTNEFNEVASARSVLPEFSDCKVVESYRNPRALARDGYLCVAPASFVPKDGAEDERFEPILAKLKPCLGEGWTEVEEHQNDERIFKNGSTSLRFLYGKGFAGLGYPKRDNPMLLLEVSRKLRPMNWEDEMEGEEDAD
jgi:hypothetical protein